MTNKYSAFIANRKKEETEKVFDVTLPSGFVWKLRAPALNQFILAGKLPAALTAKMVEITAQAEGTTEEVGAQIMARLTPAEIVQNLEFNRDLVIYCAVEPKISLNPQDENEIGLTDILPEDFEFLMNWVGGKRAESLDSFRRQS